VSLIVEKEFHQTFIITLPYTHLTTPYPYIFHLYNFLAKAYSLQFYQSFTFLTRKISDKRIALHGDAAYFHSCAAVDMYAIN
jgi:hypothetical protein